MAARIVLPVPSSFVQPAQYGEKTTGADSRACKDAQAARMEHERCHSNTVANDREDNPRDQSGQPQAPKEWGLPQPVLVHAVLIHQGDIGPQVHARLRPETKTGRLVS